MLKSLIVGVLNKLWNVPEEKRFKELAPITQPPNRESRKASRKSWKIFRSYDVLRGSVGCPGLTGARRLRTISNVYGISLPTVRMLDQNGILQERIEDENKRRHLARA